MAKVGKIFRISKNTNLFSTSIQTEKKSLITYHFSLQNNFLKGEKVPFIEYIILNYIKKSFYHKQVFRYFNFSIDFPLWKLHFLIQCFLTQCFSNFLYSLIPFEMFKYINKFNNKYPKVSYNS